jgi:hypothetical protein
MIGMNPDSGYIAGSNYWQEDERELKPVDRAKRKKVLNTNIFNVDIKTGEKVDQYNNIKNNGREGEAS